MHHLYKIFKNGKVYKRSLCGKGNRNKSTCSVDTPCPICRSLAHYDALAQIVKEEDERCFNNLKTAAYE